MMPAATDQQVQNFVDQRVRPRCEQIRNLINALRDDKAMIDDIYAALTQQSPTWADSRTDAPPHILSGSDVLAFNTFMNGMLALIDGGDTSAAAAQYPIVLKSCVHSVA